MDLYYDSVFHGDPNWAITIPGGGTTLRTLTLTGLYPIDSNLSNLKSLTLGKAESWEWSIALINTLVMGSPSLETLIFIGGESTFDIEDDVTESILLCNSLLFLGMEGGISARFATTVLLALDAPNLESVQVTTPTDTYETSLGVPVHWKQVIAQAYERDAKGISTIGQVRSVVIGPEGDGHSPQQNRDFFLNWLRSETWEDPEAVGEESSEDEDDNDEQDEDEYDDKTEEDEDEGQQSDGEVGANGAPEESEGVVGNNRDSSWARVLEYGPGDRLEVRGA
ncbi:hypothetical protein FRC01_005142 [Tulasnella sp. 417]|nr:hypothetical protein FRC01_005142 [Tulasnella sp. 417]